MLIGRQIYACRRRSSRTSRDGDSCLTCDGTNGTEDKRYAFAYDQPVATYLVGRGQSNGSQFGDAIRTAASGRRTACSAVHIDVKP